MRVELLEPVRSDGYSLTDGDIITVPDAVGAGWCAAGWAKDTEGQVETGPRVVRGVEIQVYQGQSKQKVPEVKNG
jgi:hypothetical protein